MNRVPSERASANPPRKPAASDTHSTKKYAIAVRIEPDGRVVRIEGREAWMLRHLVKAGSKGVSPLDQPNDTRMSHYVYLLRRDGFVVETQHEAHGGPFAGTHALPAGDTGNHHRRYEGRSVTWRLF